MEQLRQLAMLNGTYTEQKNGKLGRGRGAQGRPMQAYQGGYSGCDMFLRPCLWR